MNTTGTRVALERTASQFKSSTRDHTMTVVLDHPETGHRHLRFSQPRNEIWSFDIIMWPGRLVFTGDVGHYVFGGIAGDPLDFFSHGIGVKPDYWEQKVRAGTTRTDFNSAVFETNLDRIVDGWRTRLPAGEFAELRKHVAEELHYHGDFESARFALDQFHWTSADSEIVVDLSGHDIPSDGFDHFYLLTCHALRWAARHWKANR